MSNAPTPLLPPQSLHGRTLIITLAIMAFLSSLAIGAVDLIAQSANKWQGQIAQELTLQIKPVEGRNIDQDLAKARDILKNTKGIKSISVYSREQSAKLLEGWLGSNLQDLPIPRLIAIQTESQKPNMLLLKTQLSQTLPNAALEEHLPALDRLKTMAWSLVFLGVIVVVMMLTTSALTVIFATRAAVATNSAVVDVLHFVGAKDHYIARQFESHFLRLGLTGALVGVVMAAVTWVLLGLFFTYNRATATADQMEVLFGTFSISGFGWAGLIGIGILLSTLVAFTSRLTVLQSLKNIE